MMIWWNQHQQSVVVNTSYISLIHDYWWTINRVTTLQTPQTPPTFPDISRSNKRELFGKINCHQLASEVMWWTTWVQLFQSLSPLSAIWTDNIMYYAIHNKVLAMTSKSQSREFPVARIEAQLVQFSRHHNSPWHFHDLSPLIHNKFLIPWQAQISRWVVTLHWTNLLS